MSKAKPYFTIPTGSTLNPKGTPFVPGDEAAMRAALTADEIDAMIGAGHLVRADGDAAADATPTTAAPAASKA